MVIVSVNLTRIWKKKVDTPEMARISVSPAVKYSFILISLSSSKGLEKGESKSEAWLNFASTKRVNGSANQYKSVVLYKKSEIL